MPIAKAELSAIHEEKKKEKGKEEGRKRELKYLHICLRSVWILVIKHMYVFLHDEIKTIGKPWE